MADNYFIFEGRLPSLNEYIKACRTNAYIGAEMKRMVQEDISWAILQYKQKGLLKPITEPCIVKFSFYEKTQKRDIDNVSSFAAKIILDALVKQKILIDDSRKYVKGNNFRFYKNNKDYIRVEFEVIQNGN